MGHGGGGWVGGWGGTYLCLHQKPTIKMEIHWNDDVRHWLGVYSAYMQAGSSLKTPNPCKHMTVYHAFVTCRKLLAKIMIITKVPDACVNRPPLHPTVP